MRKSWTIALACVITAAMPAAADARTDNRAKPVIFVHGLDWKGDPEDNCGQWDAMKKAFGRYGHTGRMETVGYYAFDYGACTAKISRSGGNPGKHFASGHYASGRHGANTDIRHLGYHLAWWIYNNYTRRGVAVDIVAHSMGGLISRYALSRVERGHADFPPRLLIEDAVTLGSPHGGSRWFGGACPHTQCDQMDMGSPFLVDMEDTAWEPDGDGGTDWSSQGSNDDFVVAGDRAVGSSQDWSYSLYFGSCHKVVYRDSENIGHSDFKTRTGKQIDHAVLRASPDACGGKLVNDTEYYRPVRLADLAVVYGNR